jgi:hypothetical protein
MTKILGFRNFWVQPESTIENFFIPLFEKVYEEDVILGTSKRQQIDIELLSVFKSKESTLKRVFRKLGLNSRVIQISKPRTESIREIKRVWFTGENKRPPLSENYDAYLGFEKSGLNPNCFYLPLWVLNLDFFGKPSTNHRIKKVSNQESLLRNRSLSPTDLEGRKFCCIFLNNPEPMRIELIERLREIGEVDVFGSFTNNRVLDKLEVGKNYRFIICFENSLYPGYVTEKLLEAYETTALPLYWGLDRDGYFNTKSFLNFQDFENFDCFLSAVAELNTDLESLAQKINEPLLTRNFPIHEVISELKKILVG